MLHAPPRTSRRTTGPQLPVHGSVRPRANEGCNGACLHAFDAWPGMRVLGGLWCGQRPRWLYGHMVCAAETARPQIRASEPPTLGAGILACSVARRVGTTHARDPRCAPGGGGVHISEEVYLLHGQGERVYTRYAIRPTCGLAGEAGEQPDVCCVAHCSSGAGDQKGAP